MGSFLYYLVDTQLFTHFIECRLRSTSTHQQHQFQFLDLCAKAKRTKKQPFLLKQVIYEKVTPIGYPDETHLPEHPKVYLYDKFPQLQPSLFSQKVTVL